MSGAGENKDIGYDDDDSLIASPVASLVSSRTESPAESLVGTPAVSPPNSLPTPPKQPHRGTTLKILKPKRLWKSVHGIIPFRGQQKLDPDTAMDVDAVDRDIRAAG